MHIKCRAAGPKGRFLPDSDVGRSISASIQGAIQLTCELWTDTCASTTLLLDFIRKRHHPFSKAWTPVLWLSLKRDRQGLDSHLSCSQSMHVIISRNQTASGRSAGTAERMSSTSRANLLGWPALTARRLPAMMMGAPGTAGCKVYCSR